MFLLDTEECVHMDVLCLRNHLDFILAGKDNLVKNSMIKNHLVKNF